MPYFIQAALAAALFCIAQSANALIITAKLNNFESTPVTVSGIGTGGGRGTFDLISSTAPVSADLSSILDASFQAICLEPDSFITTGETYNFAVVDLAFAPTTTGGMGAARELLLEHIFGQLGIESVEDMTTMQVYRATALAYEAGYEDPINAMNMASGSAILSGLGVTEAQTALFNPATSTLDINAYALINLGYASGPATRSVFEGQDFMVFSATEVGAPGVMALFGIGLMGLAGIKRLREKA